MIYSNYSQSPVNVNPKQREAWRQWLSQLPWDWFATLTFTDEIHPDWANRLWHRWSRQLSEEAFGRRYRKRGVGVSWVRATEYTKRGVLHYHSLLNGVSGLKRLSWKDNWEGLGTFRRHRESSVVKSEKPIKLFRDSGKGYYHCYDIYVARTKKMRPKRITGFARIYSARVSSVWYIVKDVVKGGVIDMYLPPAMREELTIDQRKGLGLLLRR